MKRLIILFFILYGSVLRAQEIKDEQEKLDDIVVVAYGNAKRSSLTGAVSSIKADHITNKPYTSILSALIGKTSGVQSTLPDGQPGSSPGIRIRGFGSVNSQGEPLYIVDGSIYNGAISNINVADIESVSILKDAAATALYGSGAGNGVVLINTKRKAPRKNQISLNISQGFTKKGLSEYDRVGLWDYYQAQWEMLKNQYIYGTGVSASEAANKASANLYNSLGSFNIFKNIPNNEIVLPSGVLNPLATSLLYDDFDWEGGAFKTGYRASYTLSYSTSSETSSTYASVNYTDDGGTMVQTGYKRIGARVNSSITPFDWFEAGVNLSGSYIDAKTPMTNMTFTTAKGNAASFVRKMAPIYPVHLHNEDGSFQLDEYGNKIPDYTSKRISLPGRHVIEEAKRNKRGYTTDAYSGNTYLIFKPIKDLKIELKGSMETENGNAHVYYNTVVADGAPAGRIQMTHERFFTWDLSQLITYSKSVGNSNFNILLGHENYSHNYKYQYVYKQKQIMDGLYELDNFTVLSKLTSFTNDYKKEGYFTRLLYDYKNTYFFSGSYRRDGSSRFSPKMRWGNFWSVGGALRVDNLFKNMPHWVDILKLRASYGETGNDAIMRNGEQDYYPWQTLYTSGVNNSTEAGLYFKVFGNEDLKWETQKTLDVAVEALFNNRYEISIEYFSKRSKDLLFNVPVAPSNGIKSVWKNIGEVSNRGVEVNLNIDYLSNKNWLGSIGFNGTYLKNEIKKMPNGLKEITTSTMQLKEGVSIYEFYLRDYYGVDSDNGSALYRTEDSDNNLTTDPNKARYIFCGSSIPKFYGGFNTDLKYKNLSVSLNFSYGVGGKIYDANYAELMGNNIGYSLHKDMLKAWKQPGDITNVPRLDSSQNTKFGASSTRFLTSGNYLIFQGATIAYDLPLKWVSAMRINRFTVSFSGENMAQWNHRKGLNALANFSGYTYNLYAPAAIYSFNLNVVF